MNPYASEYVRLFESKACPWEAAHAKKFGVENSPEAISRQARRILSKEVPIDSLIWSHLARIFKVSSLTFNKYDNDTCSEEVKGQIDEMLRKLGSSLKDKPLSDYM